MCYLRGLVAFTVVQVGAWFVGYSVFRRDLGCPRRVGLATIGVVLWVAGAARLARRMGVYRDIRSLLDDRDPR